MSNTGPVRLLLIADNPVDADRLRELLPTAPQLAGQIAHVDRLAAATPLPGPEHADIVLLALPRLGPDGLSLVEQARTLAHPLPLVVLMERDDEESALSAIDRGAQDVLIKGKIDGPGLARSLVYAIARRRAEEKKHPLPQTRAASAGSTEDESRFRSPAETIPQPKGYGTATDIDVHKNPEHEQQRLYEKAQQAIKSRDGLLGKVCHDLRNPLSTIAMVTSLMLVAPAVDEAANRMRRHAEKLDRAVKRMEHIIRDLQDLVNIENGSLSFRPNPTPLAAMLTDALSAQSQAAQAKGIKLLSEPSDEGIWVACDRERILQALANLLGSAINSSPEGGTVKLRCLRRQSDVCLSVEDTGPGIAAEDLPRVFDWPGQSKSSVSTGSGLGLAISKGIIVRHGGELWAESELGRGAIFSFTLPLTSGPA